MGDRAMIVQMQNETTRDIKTLKVGFDWAAFFSLPTFGTIHFMRKLWIPAGVMAGINLFLWIILFAVAAEGDQEVFNFYFVVMLVLDIGVGVFLGRTGQARFAKHLLAQGYEFTEPDNEMTKTAKKVWGIL
jgi:hypothetical protein